MEKLGKGLKDLFNDESLSKKVEFLQTNSQDYKTEIELSKILPNPFQPRKHFDEVKLNELKESILQKGVLTPILVRKKDDLYELVAGERRFRASKLANLVKIPAIVVDFDDQDMSEVAIIENIQREDLTPLEEAKAYVELIKMYNYTQKELATKVGKSRSYIANIMRLLKLPLEVQEMLNKNELTSGHIRVLVGLPKEEALKYANIVKTKKLNVRETEKLVFKQNKKVKKNLYQNTEKELSEALKVNVKISSREIRLYYKDEHDFERLINLLKGDK
ncbi:MAG: ParB/RepB/Spo0J family partition protein [Bacilli bacterium]|nr:ParB/RepB/Spo0J family partition protein [Bacilli bacterium]